MDYGTKSVSLVIAWKSDSGKYYSFPAYSHGCNLMNYATAGYAGWSVISITACKSQQAAKDISNAWNEVWESMGEFTNPYCEEAV